MLSLFEFSELRALWLLFMQDIESCYRYVEQDGKRCMVNIDPMRTKRCHNRAKAVERALKCLIAANPAAIFYTFVCPDISLAHIKALIHHDRT